MTGRSQVSVERGVEGPKDLKHLEEDSLHVSVLHVKGLELVRQSAELQVLDAVESTALNSSMSTRLPNLKVMIMLKDLIGSMICKLIGLLKTTQELCIHHRIKPRKAERVHSSLIDTVQG